MLVPAVTTGAADVVLAYRTDTLAETAHTDVVDIDSPLAKAVQPFAIARGTPHKQLADRLFATLLSARPDFEAAGFRWRMTETDAAGGENECLTVGASNRVIVSNNHVHDGNPVRGEGIDVKDGTTNAGEARRHDEKFSYVAAWEPSPNGGPPTLHKETLDFKVVTPSLRSYK